MAETPTPERRPMMWVLLASLVVLQFGYPVTYQGQGWTVAYLLAYAGVVVFSVRRARANRRRYWPLVAASAALVGGATWFSVSPQDPSATAAMLVGMGLLQVSLTVLLGASLVKPPPGLQTTDLLLVAVCAYLLLGGVFGVLSALLELASPGAFADPNSALPLSWQGLLYGSYVTLATLGFGDIVPITPWARSLWSFEAVLGTLFVAVVIARLVGVAGGDSKRDASSPRSPH